MLKAFMATLGIFFALTGNFHQAHANSLGWASGTFSNVSKTTARGSIQINLIDKVSGKPILLVTNAGWRLSSSGNLIQSGNRKNNIVAGQHILYIVTGPGYEAHPPVNVLIEANKLLKLDIQIQPVSSAAN